MHPNKGTIPKDFFYAHPLKKYIMLLSKLKKNLLEVMVLEKGRGSALHL
jgi:hypothetical protein